MGRGERAIAVVGALCALAFALSAVPTSAQPRASVPSVTPAPQTFVATADATVAKASPTTKYGTAKYLRTRGGTAPWRSYLRFNVTGLPDATTSAKLRLRVTKASANAGVLRELTPSSWSESTITYKNAPAVPGTSVATLGKVVAGATIELDVTAALDGDGTYEFVLTGGGAVADFSSREGAFAPRLVVTPVPPPPTMPPVPTCDPPATTTTTTTTTISTATPTSPHVDLEFTDVTESTGAAAIADGAYVHSAAWGDANGDGRLDLYLGVFTHKLAVPKPSRLLLASGDGFVDAGQATLQTPVSRVSGSVFADLDNDGDDDLFVSNNRVVKVDGSTSAGSGEPSHLYRNDCGTFVDVTGPSGIGVADRNGRAIGVLDHDGDGALDLLVVADSLTGTGTRVTRLLKNDGDLGFADVTAAAGLPTNLSGLGVAVGDANGDGWPDLVLPGGVTASGSYANAFLFVNDGDGTFHDATTANLAWTPVSAEDWTAGAAWGDLDRDGRLDLVVGHHFRSAGEGHPIAPRVYLNGGNDANGDPILTELTGAGIDAIPFKSPHVEVQDFDNDGWPDVYTSVMATTETGDEPLVWRNLGTVSGAPAFSPPAFSSLPTYGPGGPTADYDGDGRVDLLLEGLDTATASVPRVLLLRNTTTTSNHWLEVTVSTPGNRPGFGAKVRIYRAGELGDPSALLGYAEVATGNGFSSGASRTVHVGLGSETTVDIEVTLPFGGPVLTRTGVSADQVVAVTSG